MKNRLSIVTLLFCYCLLNPAFIPAQSVSNSSGEIKTANPEASIEAGNLLKYLYSIQGKKTLSGLHNQLWRMSTATDQTYEITGKYPAIWGGDFGFSDSTHDIDNIRYRPLLMREIKKQYANGSIIVLTYHQANPLIGEPCPFEGGVQSKLSDEQWKDLVTPGTEIYLKWRQQMDLFAFFLSQLRDAHIPIILRPYHEMNGKWFWWGGRPGKDGLAALWKQLFDYYTKVHKLDNILWAWTPDKPYEGVEDYYPGEEYVDLLGTDIYPMKGKDVYPQEWYDRMFRLANGKPLGLSEMSVIPDTEMLRKQPWVWFMSWTAMSFGATKKEDMIKIYNSDEVITRDELPDFQNSKAEISSRK